MNFSYDAYRYFGCHWTSKGYVFRVYAPHAMNVYVVGDFNDWDTTKHPMKHLDRGVFEITIKNVMELDQYKYLLETKTKRFYKSDPFAFYGSIDNNKNSRVFSLDEYKWHDRGWMNARVDYFSKPLNIYEVHLGSWKRGIDNQYLNYRDIADELIPYVKKMGYTHIELMPVNEFPYDGSWGYQVLSYFAITARFGEPTDFMYFVDLAHQNKIGVIVDWVPAHFPKDEEGLYEFDGTYLYEDQEPTRREHQSWGTRIFDFGKEWVRSFLISSASFFFDVYHLDGLRVDAVSSMLYLDYNRKEYKKNRFGGNHNLEAIEFLQLLNKHIFMTFGSVLMIAEESTAFSKVTAPVHVGGLGFNFKWNMGWMNDSLHFIECSNRMEHLNQVTFSLMYAYAENYILPISHDEVVHGKKSLLDKMPGDYDTKFQNMRLYYGYMMAHPGKKLSFMGNEIAQFIEWNYNQGLDWILLKYPRHSEMQKYYKDLNKFYLKHPALWEQDTVGEGFLWLRGDDCLIFKRIGHTSEVLIVLNFSDTYFNQYSIGVEEMYDVAFHSDEHKYGGKGQVQNRLTLQNGMLHMDIPPLTFIILQPKRQGD